MEIMTAEGHVSAPLIQPKAWKMSGVKKASQYGAVANLAVTGVPANLLETKLGGIQLKLMASDVATMATGKVASRIGFVTFLISFNDMRADYKDLKPWLMEMFKHFNYSLHGVATKAETRKSFNFMVDKRKGNELTFHNDSPLEEEDMLDSVSVTVWLN